jgi:hypothetical protein
LTVVWTIVLLGSRVFLFSVRMKVEAQAPGRNWQPSLYHFFAQSFSLSETYADVLAQGESVTLFALQWFIERGIPCHPPWLTLPKEEASASHRQGFPTSGSA